MVKEGSEDSGKFKVSVKKKRKVAIFNFFYIQSHKLVSTAPTEYLRFWVPEYGNW